MSSRIIVELLRVGRCAALSFRFYYSGVVFSLLAVWRLALLFLLLQLRRPRLTADE
jgi:hypothetical protein